MVGDIELIRICSAKNRDAFQFAEYMHRGQVRKAREVPYFLHLVQVTEVLAALGADRNAVASGILHDVVEDTEATIEQIRERFGIYVAALVEAVTKGREFKGIRLEEQARAVCAKLDALRTEPYCLADGRDMEQLVFDGYAVKGSDLLANTGDLVFECEEDPHGAAHLGEIFGPHRAARKVRHYLELAELIASRSEHGPHARISPALRFRAGELNEMLGRFEALS